MTTGTQFKQTDIGRIPLDWDYDILDGNINEMTDYVASGSFESLNKNVSVYDKHNYAYYVRLYDLRLGLGHSKQKYIDKKSYKFLSKSNLFGNEILMANIGANVGETFIMPKVSNPASIAPNMILIRSNDKILNFKFLFYYSRSGFGRKKLFELIAGSGHPKINKTDLKQFTVLLPPLPEQEAITEVLSDTDALIGVLEKRIDKKRLIKQGTMQTLLTPKDDWKVKMIKDIVSTPVTDGPHLTPKFQTTGIPFLSVNNLIDNKVDLSDLRYISKEDDRIFSMKCKPQKGDLLFGKAASVGKIAIVEEDIDFNIWSPIALIRLNKENDSKFVYYFFQTNNVLVQISYFTNASSQGNVGMGDIEKIELALPTITEQTRIATILSDMDKEIDALEKKLSKTKELKQGLMQQLLTGKIRLV
jgi:type I restriction enzyme, S subunit